jgi:hypothetical protein
VKAKCSLQIPPSGAKERFHTPPIDPLYRGLHGGSAVVSSTSVPYLSSDVPRYEPVRVLYMSLRFLYGDTYQRRWSKIASIHLYRTSTSIGVGIEEGR